MAKKRRRKLKGWAKAVLCVFLVAGVLGGVYAYHYFTYEAIEIGNVETQKDDKEDKEKEEEITSEAAFTYNVLALGTGQCIFIDSGETEVLIDGGSSEADAKKIVSFIEDKVDGRLEYVIATNNDAARIGGLPYIYSIYEVRNTLYEGKGEGEAFDAFYNAAKKDGETTVAEKSSIDLSGGATLSLYRPVTKDKDTKKNSIVAMASVNGFTFVDTGDLDAEGEMAYRYDLSELNLEKVTALVAGDHGRETSNTIMEAFSPEYFIVSAAKDEVSQEVLSRASDYTGNIYGTYKHGNLIFTVKPGDDNVYTNFETKETLI